MPKYKKNRPCIDCGGQIYNRYNHAKRCVECSKKEELRYRKEYNRKYIDAKKMTNNKIQDICIWIELEIKRLNERELQSKTMQEKISIHGSLLSLRKLKNKIENEIRT